MAHILYFGQVAELANTQQEEMNLEEMSIATFKQLLEQKIFGLSSIPYQIAANKTLAQDDFILTNDTEIAVLPPFAGG